MHVLVVEDDEAISSALFKGLTREGFTVVCARTAARALSSLPADVILLDLGLPDGDGVDLFKSLRTVTEAPVIMVTARSSEQERVTGLDLGADDYVVKPFSLRELTARINAVTRRTRPRNTELPSIFTVRDVTLDRRAHEVRLGGTEITCTPKEYAILEFLSRDPGAVMTRQAVLDGVWGPHWFGSTKMIDVHVASLRRKLNAPDLIETVRGVGFRLAVDE